MPVVDIEGEFEQAAGRQPDRLTAKLQVERFERRVVAHQRNRVEVVRQSLKSRDQGFGAELVEPRIDL